MIKRAIDWECAALGLILLSPVMVLVAIIIRLDSKGPIFFRQERLGLGARPFRMWKFRTMHVNAEALLAELEQRNESSGGVLFKIRSDPRITRVGGFLRRTSLDELPQLFNVLAGQMSLVGPRPLPIRDCRRLEDADRDGFHVRHRVLPGLTGLWQVSGRSRLGSAEMIELDRRYVEDWSLRTDLRILARTVLVVLTDTAGAC
jgi:lipopolysaccharide/colanic/teichoic acid biosynthesis glycosyltransferase